MDHVEYPDPNPMPPEIEVRVRVDSATEIIVRHEFPFGREPKPSEVHAASDTASQALAAMLTNRAARRDSEITSLRSQLSSEIRESGGGITR